MGQCDPVQGVEEGFWECLGSWKVMWRQSVLGRKTDMYEWKPLTVRDRALSENTVILVKSEAGDTRWCGMEWIWKRWAGPDQAWQVQWWSLGFNLRAMNYLCLWKILNMVGSQSSQCWERRLWLQQADGANDSEWSSRKQEEWDKEHPQNTWGKRCRKRNIFSIVPRGKEQKTEWPAGKMHLVTVIWGCFCRNFLLARKE